jgi:hypothetical protein
MLNMGRGGLTYGVKGKEEFWDLLCRQMRPLPTRGPPVVSPNDLGAGVGGKSSTGQCSRFRRTGVLLDCRGLFMYLSTVDWP